MSCKPVCQLCPNLVISNAISYNGTNVVVNIPANSYDNGQRVCLILAQSIPTTATVNAEVVITIGDGDQLYPLTTSCCRPVTASGIRTRTRYITTVVTSATGGTFRMQGKPCCMPNNDLQSIDGTAPTA